MSCLALCKGVTQDASESDIKKAYKKAALRSHPDKCQDTSDEGREAAEKAFKDGGEAYSVLSDTQKKARYDAGQVKLQPPPSLTHVVDLSYSFGGLCRAFFGIF